MSKFVKFFAEGVVYKRDDHGRISGVSARPYGTGVAINDGELMGTVFKQCPRLLPCDAVSISAHPIG